jgi:hypothetical protein
VIGGPCIPASATPGSISCDDLTFTVIHAPADDPLGLDSDGDLEACEE